MHTQEITPWADNFKPIIPTLDPIIHTKDNPFCFDLKCPCHQHDEQVKAVVEAYLNGLLTRAEKQDIFRGILPW